MSRRRRATLAAGAILTVAVAAGAFFLLRDSDDEPGWIAAPGRAVEGATCPELPEPDHGFSRLPPVREPSFDVPSTRPWPVVMLKLLDGRLVRPGQYYGVVLADATRREVTRNWRIKAHMLALDSEGNVVEEVSHDKTGGGRGEPSAMNMRVGEEVGFYRLDLRVRGAGRWSGRYSTYLKAVPPHGEGRLAVAAARFRAGGMVGIRVENLGSEPITYGSPIHIERRVFGEWAPVPDERVWHLPLFRTAGGEVGACEGFSLPEKLGPGQYRFVKEVSTRKQPRGYHDHHVTAEFEISGRGG